MYTYIYIYIYIYVHSNIHIHTYRLTPLSLSVVPPARYCHAACAVDGALVVCGGWAPGRYAGAGDDIIMLNNNDDNNNYYYY